jgi:hypothetical protein
MAAFHHRSELDCLVALGATPEMLTAAKAERRLAVHGPRTNPLRGIGAIG